MDVLQEIKNQAKSARANGDMAEVDRLKERYDSVKASLESAQKPMISDEDIVDADNVGHFKTAGIGASAQFDKFGHGISQSFIDFLSNPQVQKNLNLDSNEIADKRTALMAENAEREQLNAPLEENEDAQKGKALAYLTAMLAPVPVGGQTVNTSVRSLPSAQSAISKALRLGKEMLKSGGINAGIGGGIAAIEPYSEEGEKEENIASGIGVGGALGLAVPPVIGGAIKSKKVFDNILPEDIGLKIADRLGFKDKTAALQGATDTIKNTYEQLRESFNRLYDNVEKNPDLPEINFAGLKQKLIDYLGAPDKMIEAGFTPTMIKAVSRIKEEGMASFEQARNIVRSLRDKKLYDLADEVTYHMDSFYKTNGMTNGLDALDEARKIDTMFKNEVIPFREDKTPLNNISNLSRDKMRSEPSTAKFENLLDENSGPYINSISKTIPYIKQDMQEILAAAIRGHERNKLPNSPVEAILNGKSGGLSSDEYRYYKKAQDESFSEKYSKADRGEYLTFPVIKSLYEITKRTPVINKAILGVRPYPSRHGYEISGSLNPYSSALISKYLRSEQDASQ